MAEALLQALNALYHHPDPQVKDNANKWLEGWRQTTEAWQISDALLHDPNSDKQTQLFCAQTLKAKVQQNFEELPSESCKSLLRSLVALLVRYAVGFPPVKTQLCLALAAFVAHSPVSQWENLGCVQWFANTLGAESKEVAVPCMLEMLAVLPEEAESRHVGISPGRRDMLRKELRDSFPVALRILSGCIGSPDVIGQVLKAFTSWLRMCQSNESLESLQIHQHAAVKVALEALKGTSHFSDAVDVICELLWLSSVQYRPTPKLMPLVQMIVPEILSQIPRFDLMLHRAQALVEGKDPDQIQPGNYPDDDDEIAKSLARLLTELGIDYASLIIEGSELQNLVTTILLVTAHPDENVFAMGIDFWQRIAQQLSTSFSDDPSETASSLSKDRFAPVYERLIGVLEAHVRYPQNYLQLREDEKSDITHKRDKVRVALTDTALFLGGRRTVEIFLNLVTSKCQNAGGIQDWAGIEAGLFCLRSVSSCVTSGREQFHGSLFNLLASLPDDKLVQRSACNCIAAYSDWLGKELQQGNHAGLQKVLQMLMHNMGRVETSGSAANAFLLVCESCSSFMEQYVDGLIEIWKRVLSASDARRGWATPQSGGPQLTDQDTVMIMEGVCQSISSSLPPDRRMAPLAQLAEPLLVSLEQTVNLIRANPGNTHTEQISIVVDRLSAVFKCYDHPEGMADLSGRVWVLINAALASLTHDTHTIERICRCVRSGLKASGVLCAPMLQSLAKSLPSHFSRSQHSAFLYVASEIAKIFGCDMSKAELLKSLLMELLTKACEKLRVLEDFDQNPCIADDTFLLAKRMLQYCPGVLFSMVKVVEMLLDTACAGMLVQHGEACCSILSFLSRVLNPSRVQELGMEDATAQIRRAFCARGKIIMRLFVAGIAGTLPFSRLEDVTESLHCILSDTRPEGCQWLCEALGMLPDNLASNAERKKFVDIAKKAENDHSSRELENAVYDFADVCRRSKAVRISAQRAVLPQELHQAVF